MAARVTPDVVTAALRLDDPDHPRSLIWQQLPRALGEVASG
jgi:hypothetical protein